MGSGSFEEVPNPGSTPALPHAMGRLRAVAELTASTEKPTVANWTDPPGNRWAFLHLRELFPTARVPAPKAPRELGSGSADWFESIQLDAPELLGESAEAYLEDSYTDAIVVLHRGKLVAERYRSGVDPDTPHILMSVTKSVTGLLAGALAGVGKLDLEAPIVDWIPEAADSAFGDARVRHLLDMTASTSFVEDYSPGPEMAAYRRAAGWIPPEGDPVGLHEYLCSLEARGEHGVTFDYASTNADMLGWVCERASEMTFADALSHYIWGPLGAETDADVALDRRGAARSTGGLCATVRDMARLGLVVTEDGAGVVSSEFVRDLLRGGDPEAWKRGEWSDFIPGGAYRNCWYQLRDEQGAVLALGIHGQIVYADPTRGVVVAKQSSWPTPEDDAAEVAAISFCRAIGAALGDQRGDERVDR